MRSFFLPILVLAVLGCSEKPDVSGLWELHQMDVDMIPKGFRPTYIRFEKDGTFFVSKEKGDVLGLYQIDKKLLTLTSNDENWFNRKWQVLATEDELVFNDVKNSFRGAQMRFRKIEKFPSFDEFLEKLRGKWMLYKIIEKGDERRVSNMQVYIGEEQYQILEGTEVTEEGSISIDTRHHKITFEKMEIAWEVRFVWDDLRLENEEMGLTYRLRRIKK